MTLPPDVLGALRTLSNEEIGRRYGLPKKSLEVARKHHGIPSPTQRGSVTARIIALLKPGPMTTAEIARALPDVSQVRDRLKVMRQKGQIEQYERRWKVKK